MTAVIAHRGASRAAVENTLEAFDLAASMGADAVELDVRRTADGALVVHHDAHLADGRAIVEVERGDLPAHVPDLDAALDACAGIWVNVEIKNDEHEPDFDPTDDVAGMVADALLARGDDARWLVSSFRIETVDRLRTAAPSIATAWLVVDGRGDVPERCASHGHVALHPSVAALDAATILRCHDLGLRVNTWTCDDPERMAELAAAGVDGLCTNVPDVALRVLGR
jgi:glycerophosphoryl diester phosphodiesterase